MCGCVCVRVRVLVLLLLLVLVLVLVLLLVRLLVRLPVRLPVLRLGDDRMSKPVAARSIMPIDAPRCSLMLIDAICSTTALYYSTLLQHSTTTVLCCSVTTLTPSRVGTSHGGPQAFASISDNGLASPLRPTEYLLRLSNYHYRIDGCRQASRNSQLRVATIFSSSF